MDIEAFVSGEVYRTLLVFARLGTALMVMPGFGDEGFPATARLLFALVLSAALAHAVPGLPTAVPADHSGFIAQVGVETLAGFFLGFVARALTASLHFAGHLAAQTSGMANAMAGGMVGGVEAGTLASSALMWAGVALVFAADIHHLALEGLLGSYRLIPPGSLPAAADYASEAGRAVAESFAMGFRFATPFLVIALVVNVGLGLANRMMAALPVFFVAAPVNVAGGLVLLALASGGVLAVFGDRLAEWFTTLSL